MLTSHRITTGLRGAERSQSQTRKHALSRRLGVRMGGRARASMFEKRVVLSHCEVNHMDIMTNRKILDTETRLYPIQNNRKRLGSLFCCSVSWLYHPDVGSTLM